MTFLDVAAQNLLSPAPLFFVLGIGAGLLKSDLEVPDGIARCLALYLMMAIGFKGGASLAAEGALSGAVWLLIAIGIGMSFAQPYLGYALLRRTTRLDQPTAAAVAAHYGSISMVTFATASAFLKSASVKYAGYIVAVLALMEAPAILSGLSLARRSAAHPAETRRLLNRDIFTNGAILMLTGAFAIGWITGAPGLAKMHAFLVDPFQGLLAFFLLDMGLLVSRNAAALRRLTPPLVAFGIYMPLIGAGLGLGVARILGLDPGTGTLFMVLCGSASYIAVPAAMRLALPEAEASVYLPLSLAVTFPFNVVLGIPLYYTLASRVL